MVERWVSNEIDLSRDRISTFTKKNGKDVNLFSILSGDIRSIADTDDIRSETPKYLLSIFLSAFKTYTTTYPDQPKDSDEDIFAGSRIATERRSTKKDYESKGQDDFDLVGTL